MPYPDGGDPHPTAESWNRMSLTLSGPMVKGVNRVAFFGAGLTPGGKYVATITLTDAAGNVSKAKTLTFHYDGVP